MQLTVNNNKKPRLFEFCLFFLIIHRHFPSPPNFFVILCSDMLWFSATLLAAAVV